MQGKLYYCALSLILGIAVSFFSFHWLSLLFTILFLAIIFLREGTKLFLIVIVTLLFSSIYFWFYDGQNTSSLSSDHPPDYFMGHIISIPVIKETGASFIFRLSSGEKIKVTSKDANDLKYGLACVFQGKLNEPKHNTNFNAFDYHDYLYRARIHWELRAQSIKVSEQCKDTKAAKGGIAKLRSKGLEIIKNNYTQPTAGIVQALILGERSQMDKSLLTLFQKFGLIHLLAISGLHVGLVVASLFFLGIRIGITREMTFRIIFCFLPFYILLTGASPSVLRACLMVMVFILFLRFQSKINALDSISVVCIGLLLFRPYFLFEAGFQLSFVVSLFLIVSSGLISSYQSNIKRILAVTFIAQLGSLPILLYHFYEFSILSIPLNMLFVPVFTMLILPLSIISFLSILIIPPVGLLLGNLLSIIINVCFQFLSLINMDWLTLTLGRPPIIFLCLYIVSIIFLLISWELHSKLHIQLASCCLLLVLIFHYFLPDLTPTGEVTMLDVGQGDSFFIRLPFGQGSYLIDAGGSFGSSWDPGEDVVIPYLKSKGIRKLDKLIVTHGDFDHIGGMTGVLNNISVNTLVVGKGPIETDVEREIFELAKEKDVSFQSLKRGDQWKAGKTIFFVLSPTGDEQSRNNRSIVLYAKIGGKTWLFTGDLEKEGELSLTEHYPHLQADILKVGHHGSHSSTTKLFLQKLKPEAALISVGAQNRYGHPDEEVVSRLMDKKIRIYRTDKHGALTYRFFQNKGTFRHVLP